VSHTERLFSYGTLQQENVQKQTFGRLLDGTPDALVGRIHDEIGKVLAEPEVREKLRAQYMDVVANTPAEFRAAMKADVERWKPVIERNAIKLD